MSGNDSVGSASGWLRRLGMHDVHPWVFLAHAVVAAVVFVFGTFALLDGAGIRSVPTFGIGLMILLLGRSAGRIAARR